MHRHIDFPDFCDDEVYVFSTIGQGPAGEVGNPGPQGPKGDKGDPGELPEDILTDSSSFDILYDGFIIDVSSWVTCVRMDRSKYVMKEFIKYSTMNSNINYHDVFSQYENTVFCAPNLPSDYFIRDGAFKVNYSNPWCLLCVDADNNYSIVEVYDTAVTADSLIQNGIKNALWVWEPLVINGESYDVSRIPIATASRDKLINNRHPRFIFGWDDDFIYLVVVNGRIPFGSGTTHDESVSVCNKLGIANAINCDGGGSVQLWLCPDSYNLAFIRNPDGTIPLQSRAKPMTGFSAV